VPWLCQLGEADVDLINMKLSIPRVSTTTTSIFLRQNIPQYLDTRSSGQQRGFFIRLDLL
jgi:hypothetical protein